MEIKRSNRPMETTGDRVSDEPRYSLRCSGVSELTLMVEDLKRAEAFYAGTLDLPVAERWENEVWLMAGERTRIGLWLPGVEPLAGERCGRHVHFALHVDEQDLDPLVTHLRRSGHDAHVSRFPDGRGRAAYVPDPDGHVVEFWTWDVAGHLAAVAAGRTARAEDASG
jgi:catechol 2,3-dioxygenase-like lactoylglutathione lyase family enzyme